MIQPQYKESSDPNLIAKKCNETPGCVGFSSTGWMRKDALAPLTKWHEWTTDPTKGFYHKKSVTIPLPPAAAALESYKFTPFLDSPGNNISQYTNSADPELIAKACDAAPDCVGFNSNGWLKREPLKPLSAWTSWTTNPAKGFYHKKSYEIPSDPTARALDDYLFTSFRDSPDGDISQYTASSDPNKIAEKCNATAGCVGFNSNGWLKRSPLRPLSLWTTWTQDPSKGFYHKKNYTLPLAPVADDPAALNHYTTHLNNMVGGVTNSAYEYINIFPGDHTPSGLAQLCDAAPGCNAFMTDGTGHALVKVYPPLITKPTTGTDLYTKGLV